KIPIVMAGAGVPVSLGFIESLARSGGNITGVVNQAETLAEKNLELLKEISPGMERVGIVHSPENVSSLAGIKCEKEQIGPRLGLVVVLIPVSKPGDLDEAFATVVREASARSLRPPNPSGLCAAGKNCRLCDRAASADYHHFERHGSRRASHVL